MLADCIFFFKYFFFSIPENGQLDSAFNLTNTYRRDSDIQRRFGDIENQIVNSNRTLTFQNVMLRKQPYNKELKGLPKFTFFLNSYFFYTNSISLQNFDFLTKKLELS